MDFKCRPDLAGNDKITAESLMLFQRFSQDADNAWLEKQMNEEIARHVHLCELVIACHAHGAWYWCELPQHPAELVDAEVHRILEERGFKIEHHTETKRATARNTELVGDKTVDVALVRQFTTAQWLHLLGADDVSPEWKRRQDLEDEELARNPPAACTKVVDGKLSRSEAIWACRIGDKYLAEVQPWRTQHVLCIFDEDERSLFCEKVYPVAGARFGPDVCDVAEWEDRANQVLAKLGRISS